MTRSANRTAEIEVLLPEMAPLLRRIVGANLRAPDWVVDDACQLAWEALLSHPTAVDRSRMLGWLATTARREGLALLREEARTASLEAGGEELLEPLPGPQQTAEFWERLGELRRLSRHQQRIVWMQGLGFAHAEIAAETGQTVRSVNRQLHRARRRVQSAA